MFIIILCFFEQKKPSLYLSGSLFNKFHSIDGCSGPVNNKLIDTASINKSNSYPPTNPFDSLTA